MQGNGDLFHFEIESEMRNDKVAMVTTILPVTHYSRYLAKAFQSKLGEKVTMFVYTDRRKENEKVPLDNVKLVWTPNLMYPFQIVRQVIADKLDLVHLQHEFNMYGGPITAVLFPLLVLLLKLTRKRVVVTIHAVVSSREIDLSFLEVFSWPKKTIVLILAKWALGYIYTATCWFSNMVIVHSRYMKSILVSDYKANEGKIRVLPHGVPERVVSKTEEINAAWVNKTAAKRIILYFGYVVKRKGLEDLIEAFEQVSKKYQDYILVLAGGALPNQKDYMEKLKKIVQQKGLSRQILFTSFVPEEELIKLLARAEFVVLPSIYSISASGPLAQAISLFKPVIATDLGTFHEDLNDGIDGLLCPPRDVPSLTKAMIKLIENPTLLREIAEGIKRKAKERQWSNIATRTFEIYLGELKV